MAKTSEKRGIKRAREYTEEDNDSDKPEEDDAHQETIKSHSEYSFRDAAIKVLRDAGRPLSAKEISELMIDQGLITTAGKTPDRTVAARIYSEIKTKANKSAFCQVGRGVFALTNFTEEQKANIEVPTPVRKKKKTARKKKSSKSEEEKPAPSTPTSQQKPAPSTPNSKPATVPASTLIYPQHPAAEGYNDSFGYLYLRYFLDITKRQECGDHSPEDDCFICKNGGDLICCDFPVCCKVYHLSCLNMESMPEGKWYCPWHTCVTCRNLKENKIAVHHCATCTNAYCEEHLPKNDYKEFRKGDIICGKCLPFYTKEIDEDDE